jgi:hypothetical protein
MAYKVNHKAIRILFLVLFSWNALFSAVGGVLICIHDDSQMHADVGQKNEADCETAHASCGTVQQNITAADHCLDLELDAVEAMWMKVDQSHVPPLLTFRVSHTADFNSGLTLRELAPDCQPQAPPLLTDVSVYTVQLTQLRI